MASRRLVPASVREAILGIPSDIASLERNYLLADDDLDLIGTRRRPENRLGLALHIALLRHPGQGWLDDTDPPTPLVAWLAEQIKVPFPAQARYGSRGATRSNHRRLAIRHLGLRAFVPAHDMRTAMDVAARAAFDTDDGRIILARVSGAIQAQRFVLPSADTLERIGLAGRARARRLSAQAVNDALDDERKAGAERVARVRSEPRPVPTDVAAYAAPVDERTEHARAPGAADLCAGARAPAPSRRQHPPGQTSPVRTRGRGRAGQPAQRFRLPAADRFAGRTDVGAGNDATPQRRIYETAVVATLRDRLRAGDVWVAGSQDYRRFDAYLVPLDDAQRVLGDSALDTDGPAWLTGRRERLHDRLREVRAKLVAGRLDGVRLEKSRLKITPYDPLTPPAGERLDRTIDALMPRIRITDLLWDVHAFTGFLDAFTDLRSGRVHANPAALLASILAGATNLGLERMARASSGVSHAQLSWASAWCLRSETYANALARIIDAHHALPVASVWGSTSRTSSDGQFFASGRRNAGEINAKYGPDPGLKIYSFLSGRYGSFHSNVIGATAGEAPFVLDGLVGNAAQFDPLVHHVDTGGVSDHVFALFHLLGLSFAPRLRDFPDRRLACFGRPGRWKELAPLMGKPINEEVVLEHWNDALRLTASIKTVSVMPSAMLRKLGAYRQQNRLYLALGEIGRIERTLFMLDWMESPQLRMECQAGLNKGEARHALARAVFAHAQGRVHDRSHEAQQKRVMALNLVIAAIVYWNTAYIEKAATHLRRERRLPDPTLLRHVSPLGWEHIVLTGDYDWNSGAAERTNARPLNLYPAKIRA